jgi:hypothetical protein
MKLTRVCLVSLGCVAGAIAFGIAANAAIDLVMPSAQSAKAVPLVPVKAAQDKAAQDKATQEQPAAFALASATATPVDLGPLKIKTVPIVVRDGELIEQVLGSNANNYAAAKVPLPRPRPATAPAHETTASIARQPGSLAITAATRKPAPDEGEALSAANIDRMKMALALTAEQEEFWPAIAVELQAIGKTLSRQGKAKGQTSKISVDDETKQRLYWAAAPLLTRLSYEQKLKAKQMARLMGLNEVAEAL